ncbi:MAG: 50S ribosomal protein L30e, partial [Candidatus ainarchaeum sp.]|nr:50S ribosomal protein L30e [Candidatus ainarchaeum sp.]
SSLRNIKNGTPKLIVVSKNIPEVHLSKVNSFAKNSKIMVYTFSGTAKELASICGKPYLISVLSILNPGNSNILDLVSK